MGGARGWLVGAGGWGWDRGMCMGRGAKKRLTFSCELVLVDGADATKISKGETKISKGCDWNAFACHAREMKNGEG